MPAGSGVAVMIGVVRAIVSRIYPSGTFDWRAVDHDYGEVAAQYDEGVSWIRGHHAPDSKEVAAMRVASALELKP